MATETRPNYHATLQKKAEQVYNEASGANESTKSVEIIYQALKDVALESWKNGIQAGRRKASQKPAQSTKSA